MDNAVWVHALGLSVVSKPRDAQGNASKGSWPLGGGQRKSQVFVLITTNITPVDPVPLDTPRANIWTMPSFTKYHVYGCVLFRG